MTFAILGPDRSIVVDNMLSEWGEIPYAELSVLLVHLRYVALVHQTAHWTCKGDNFFGDHLLHERLYNDVLPEIDAVAEKAVGLGNENNVNVVLQTLQLMRLVQQMGTTMIPQSNQLVSTTLDAEMNLLKVIGILELSLKEKGTSTSGLSNLIQGIADKHEEHTFLLKQRLKS
jgi:DNA-binding ferritin-like protein